MILVLHILIALASLANATISCFSPSKTKLRITYGLVASVLVSGIYLGVQSRAHMLQLCVSGLVYLGTVLLMTVTAHHKLALQTRLNR